MHNALSFLLSILCTSNDLCKNLWQVSFSTKPIQNSWAFTHTTNKQNTTHHTITSTQTYTHANKTIQIHPTRSHTYTYPFFFFTITAHSHILTLSVALEMALGSSQANIEHCLLTNWLSHSHSLWKWFRAPSKRTSTVTMKVSATSLTDNITQHKDYNGNCHICIEPCVRKWNSIRWSKLQEERLWQNLSSSRKTISRKLRN